MCIYPQDVKLIVRFSYLLYYLLTLKFVCFDPTEHLPDFTSTDGLLNVASLYSIMVFLNAIHPLTYQYPDAALAEHDQNSLSFPERISTMYARGKAYDLLSWIFTRFAVIDSRSNTIISDPMREIVLPHLVSLQMTLNEYKKLADMEGFNVDIPLKALHIQLKFAIQSFDDYTIAEYQAVHSLCAFDSLHWDDHSHLMLTAEASPVGIHDPCKKPFL